MYSDKENVNLLTALLVAHGVEHVVVCPGSRNAPLVHNFNECPSITCHPVTDERSAGFIAIGLRQQLGSPVAVCVTSGSALLNVLPAVAEATYQQCGILVISADRPQAWIGQLDGQTLPQTDALGRFVGKSVSLPEPHNDEERWYCQRLVNETFLTLNSAAHPSVHINVPISEPLFNFTVVNLPEVHTVSSYRWAKSKEELLRRLLSSHRPLIVIGQTAKGAIPTNAIAEISAHIPVLCEPLSSDFPSCTDQIISLIQDNPQEYMPDVVLYMGGHTVSKRLRQFLRSLKDAQQMTISEDGTLHDVSKHTSIVIEGEVGEVLTDIRKQLSVRQMDDAFASKWNMLRKEIMAQQESCKLPYSQKLAVKLFEETIQDTSSVYYANSTAVRLASLYARHYCYCNRGLNGIEGSLSVAAGASLAQAMKNDNSLTYCIIGDLSFFYDENALWQQQLGGNLRILLLNNGQGGIFRHLEGLEKSAARDALVAARHATTAEGICSQFDIHYLRATDEASLRAGMELLHSLRCSRPVLLEVMTDVNDD